MKRSIHVKYLLHWMTAFQSIYIFVFFSNVACQRQIINNSEFYPPVYFIINIKLTPSEISRSQSYGKRYLSDTH